MSMKLEFEPHSWYYEFAIKQPSLDWHVATWRAFVDDGNNYRIVELEANSLKEIKRLIRSYWIRHGTPAFYACKLARYGQDGNFTPEIQARKKARKEYYAKKGNDL